MAFFGQAASGEQQERITDIEQMEFRRHDETVVQRFADISLPRCPLCRDVPRWKIHIANITTSMFPVQEVDRIYHLKCQCCGAVLHTRHHTIGSSLPVFIMSPNSQDSVTRMVLDDPGRNPQRQLDKDNVYTISELNQQP